MEEIVVDRLLPQHGLRSDAETQGRYSAVKRKFSQPICGGWINPSEDRQVHEWLNQEGTRVDFLTYWTCRAVAGSAGGVTGGKFGGVAGSAVPGIGTSMGMAIGGFFGFLMGSLAGARLGAKYINGQRAYRDWHRRREIKEFALQVRSFFNFVDVELQGFEYRCAVTGQLMSEVWKTPKTVEHPKSRLVDVSQAAMIEGCKLAPLPTARLYQRLGELLEQELGRDLSPQVKRGLARIACDWREQTAHYRELALNESEVIYSLRPDSSTSSLFLVADDIAIRLQTGGYSIREIKSTEIKMLAKLSWYARKAEISRD